MEFENTRKALAEYDEGAIGRQAAWECALTNEDVLACETRDKAAVDKVREAFYLDTSDRNSKANCMIADIHFMSQCVRNAE